MTDELPSGLALSNRRWVDRLARFHAADQTVVQFCAAESVSVPAFYQWKRQLAAAGTSTDLPVLLTVRIAAPAPIELALPGGAVVRFAAGTDPGVIATVVRQIAVGGC